jgi:hypothetical protein
MRKLAIILTMILLCNIVLILSPIVSATDPWYNTNWDYRKSLTVSGKIIGDTMRLVVVNNTGVGNLTCSGHVMNDFRDLVFTDTSKNILSYWVQNYTVGVRATVWINNSLNVSTMYMYYGNPGATSSSNGNTTFWFFDDFNGTSLNLQKWAKTGTPTVTILNSELALDSTATNQYISSKKSFGLNYGMYGRIKEVSVSNPWQGFGFGLCPASPYNNPPYVAKSPGGATSGRVYWGDGSNPVQYGNVFNSIYSYYFMKVMRLSNYVRAYTNDTSVAYSSTSIPTGSLYPSVGVGGLAQGGTQKVIMDWVFVKKFWNIEPYWSSFGAEEIHAPVNSNPNPVTYSVVLSSPVLSIYVSDIDNDYMNQIFRSNHTGSWQTLSWNNHTLNATLTYTTTFYHNNYSCYWSSNLTDNHSHWTNNSYHYYMVRCPSKNLTISNHHVNTTWTNQYKYNFYSGYTYYDNDTGNLTSYHFYNNHIDTMWSHLVRQNSTGYWIYDNDTGNASGGSYNFTINMTSIDGFNFSINWTGDYNSTNTNITVPVNSSMVIHGAIEVISMNVVIDITQMGLVFITLLTMFCVLVGYLMNNSTGGVFLLISAGLIFNLMVLVWIYFAGVYAISMTPLFVALLMLFAKDGIIRLKNKNLNK